ncbi:MAG TPA: hypothetical protein VFQ07_14260 [Candidatus Polarisedimenticolia bacterium]|nr:hypothetical protein [Candidatus Polarisedimenticolia bacterium]
MTRDGASRAGRPAAAFAAAAVGLLLGATTAVAQQSPSYDLREHTLNAGGHPASGAVQSSATYRVSLDAIGDFAGTPSSSVSFQVGPGFVPAHPPPSEVTGVLFRPDNVTFTWNVEPAAGTYQVYRDLLSRLQLGATGTCWQSGLVSPQAVDAQLPAAGAGYFYWITSRNSLAEEGTKGFRSSGLERPNPLPCP